LVTVPVFSLLGLSDEPAILDGYGPIPPSMARRLVADGAPSFLRVLTEPRDGAPLEIGRTSYRLTKPMRQWIRLRDARCTFPSCNNHSLDNDADHILAWADGGGTGVANLGQPWPKHHRLKHATAWKPVGATRDTPPGWISPSGRHFPAEYQDWEPPTWPAPPSGQTLQDSPAGHPWLEPRPGQVMPQPPWPHPWNESEPVSGQDWNPPTWPELPSGQDWRELRPDQNRPELPPGQEWPEPQAWLAPEDWLELPGSPMPPDCADHPVGFTDHPTGFEGFATHNGIIDAVSFDDTDSYDATDSCDGSNSHHGPDAVTGPEPPPPVNPCRGWTSSPAA